MKIIIFAKTLLIKCLNFIKRKSLENAIDKIILNQNYLKIISEDKKLKVTNIFLNLFGIKFYNGITEVNKSSPIHDFYLLQRYPDPMITNKPNLKKKFRSILQSYDNHPWSDPIRLLTFYYLFQYLKKINGNLAELGVLDGKTSKLIFELMDKNETLYSFDTFEGFHQSDVDIENRLFEKKISYNFFTKKVSLRKLQKFIIGNEKKKKLQLIKGKFPDSLDKGMKNLKFKFIHIDMDLYEPTKMALKLLWKQLVVGGVMLVHDYQCSLFPGVEKAVNEFCESKKIVPIICCDSQGSAIITRQK